MNKSQIYSLVRKMGVVSLTVAASMPLLIPTTAFAQDDDEVLEEVIAVGIRGSLDSAAEVKRNGDAIIDAITAEDLGVFSDNNIGEALSRIPGIALERSEGEGYRISVRGLGPRFVRTTLNGRTALSSPGGENGRDSRGFSFNIIPSEVINKAQVYKSFRAIDIEGGIGGTVDLQTVRPLDFAGQKKNDFYMSGALRSTYNTLSEDTTPRGSIFANYKVNDQFGFFLSGVMDNSDRVQNSTESQDLDIERFDLAAGTLLNGEALTEETRFNAALFDGVRNYNRNRQRDRLTFTGGFQWQPSDTLDVNFDWTHGTMDEQRDDYRSQLRVEDAVDRQADDTVTSMIIDFADAGENSDGSIMAFEFEGFEGRKGLDLAHLTQVTDETIDVGGVNVSWSDRGWTVSGDLGFAAQEKVTNQRRVTFGESRNSGSRWEDGFNGSFDIRGGYPIVTLTDTLGVPYDHNSTEDIIYDQDRISLYLEDNQEVNFRLDAETEMDNEFIDLIKFGVSLRDTDRTREDLRTNGSRSDRDENGDRPWDNIPVDSVGTVAVTDFFGDVSMPGFYNSYMVPDFYAWLAADPRGTFAGSPYDGAPRINREYNVSEKISAIYAQLDFSNDNASIPFRGNVGIRFAKTRQTSAGILGDQVGNDVIIYEDNFVIEREYSDILPSINLAMDLADDWVLRFAASRALSRPDPVDLQIGLDIDIEDLDGRSGNPDLERYGTDNFDAILEWYPEIGGSYAVGVFYKKLDSWISGGEETLEIDLGEEFGGLEEFDISRPVNTDGGEITGYEVAFHVPFDVFSDAMSGFGLQGSYTYIDAKMDSVNPDTLEPISLIGTSENTANLVAYYERGPFGARAAVTYRDDFLHQEGAEGFLEYTEGTEVIDVNLNWKFNEQWRLRLTGNNLTDEQLYRYFVRPHLMSDIRDDGRSYVVELRANF